MIVIKSNIQISTFLEKPGFLLRTLVLGRSSVLVANHRNFKGLEGQGIYTYPTTNSPNPNLTKSLPILQPLGIERHQRQRLMQRHCTHAALDEILPDPKEIRTHGNMEGLSSGSLKRKIVRSFISKEKT